MSEDKKFTDYIKKVEMGDLKILVIGLVLLFVPIIGLMFLLGSDDDQDYIKEHLQNMASRRSVFRFPGASGRNSAPRGYVKQGGWFSDASPEKKTEMELEDAVKAVQRSSLDRARRFSSSSDPKKQAYAADMDPSICNARGALEVGRLAEAEKFYEEAFKRGDENIFLKLQAISGLCRVYNQMENLEKFEKAFQMYMDIVAKLPPGLGGGDLRASVRNAFLMLKKLKTKASSGKVSQAVLKNKLANKTGLNSSALKAGVEKALKFFPAKFQ